MRRFKKLFFFLSLIVIWPVLALSQDPGEPDTAIVECIEFVGANSQVVLDISIVNDSAIGGFQIPLAFPDTVTHLDISCDSISFVGTRAASANSKSDSLSIDNSSNRLVVFALWLAGALAPGNGVVAKIYFSTGPFWDSTLYVPVDRMIWPPSTDLVFSTPEPHSYVPAFVAGCIGTGKSPSRNDTLSFIAYSPVDLIVTDPADDSIGVDFNTIPDASYDTTSDVNQDGEDDDVVTIPNPLLGEYTVRVVGEPGAGGGSYTLAVKIDGNEDTPMVAGTAPGPGEVDTVYYPVTQYLRGDPNSDGSKSVSDVVFLINYLFKGGLWPDPLFLGDVNCDGSVTVSDVVYMVNYLFKGGNAPCS